MRRVTPTLEQQGRAWLRREALLLGGNTRLAEKLGVVPSRISKLLRATEQEPVSPTLATVEEYAQRLGRRVCLTVYEAPESEMKVYEAATEPEE